MIARRSVQVGCPTSGRFCQKWGFLSTSVYRRWKLVGSARSEIHRFSPRSLRSVSANSAVKPLQFSRNAKPQTTPSKKAPAEENCTYAKKIDFAGAPPL